MITGGFHQCDNVNRAWVYRPEATVVGVSDFAEGTVIDTVAIATDNPCLPCALYDALLDRRARIIAPNAAGVRVPMPAVVGDRIRLAFKNASEVGTRPPAAVQPGSPPIASVVAVGFPLLTPSTGATGASTKAGAPALPKKGQTLSMFGAAIMAAPSGPKPPDAYVRRKEPELKLSDLNTVDANFEKPPVDEKAKRRSNILRLVKKGE